MVKHGQPEPLTFLGGRFILFQKTKPIFFGVFAKETEGPRERSLPRLRIDNAKSAHPFEPGNVVTPNASLRSLAVEKAEEKWLTLEEGKITLSYLASLFGHFVLFFVSAPTPSPQKQTYPCKVNQGDYFAWENKQD